jgi:hypothetical protein
VEGEALAGSVVDLVGDVVEVGLAVDAQVGDFGKYWRRRPFMFSLVPRCQGEWGSQK